ncbi:peptidyl-prolyl cis-trans isomerase FKBP3-like [Stigmatopora argus]
MEQCSAFVPQRAQTFGKHQECGQKGGACRHHNELFVSKRFKATDTVEEVKAVKIEEKTKKVQAEVVHEGPLKFTKSTLKKGDTVSC